MAKKQKLSKKKKIELSFCIVLIVLIGICLGLSIMYGISKEWIGFTIYLSAAIVMSAIEIPLNYHGTIYECPQCAQKFKVNPYKVFFTNGFLDIFNLDGGSSKFAKLKCTNCKKKDWCKKHHN